MPLRPALFVALLALAPAWAFLGCSGSSTSGSTTGTVAGDAHVQHCLDRLNTYRSQNGAAPLKLDANLNAFATAGSQQLMQDHAPHAHFGSNTQQLFDWGFHHVGENQGDPHGWPSADIDTQIDQILQAMMAEGTGGGHHDNIVSTDFRAVGVGLVTDAAGKLYFTNDFGG